MQYFVILHFTFLFSLFVIASAAGHYFRILTGSIWTGQVPALFQIKSIIQQIVHVTSGHMAYDPQCHELFAIYILFKTEQKTTGLTKYEHKAFVDYLQAVRPQCHISDREQRFQQSTKLRISVSIAQYDLYRYITTLCQV